MNNNLEKFKEFLPNKKQSIIPIILLLLIGAVFIISLDRNSSKINKIESDIDKLETERNSLSDELSEKKSKIEDLESKVKDASIWFELTDEEKTKVKQDLEKRKDKEKKEEDEKNRREESSKKIEKIKEYSNVFNRKTEKALYHCDKFFTIFKSISTPDPEKGKALISEIDTLMRIGGELNLYTDIDELKEINELANDAGENLIESSNKFTDAVNSTGTDADMEEGYNLILKSSNELKAATKKLKTVLSKYNL